jgi:hypothetical protein
MYCVCVRCVCYVFTDCNVMNWDINITNSEYEIDQTGYNVATNCP